MPAKIEMKIGRRFGRLIIRKEAGSGPGGIRWLCVCDCGNQIVVTGCHLRAKPSPTRSCGCFRREVIFAKGRKKAREANTQHGHASKRTQVYAAWVSMIQRCTNPNHSNGKSWKNYGGRGITVCKRWLNSFQNFLDDMGERPEGDYLLDRKNNNKNYTPGNCNWSIRAESIVNQRSHGPPKKVMR